MEEYYDSDNESDQGDISNDDTEIETDSDSDCDDEIESYVEDVNSEKDNLKIFPGKNSEINWFSEPQKLTNNIPSPESNRYGITHESVPSHSVLSTFEFFITDDIIEEIVQCSNKRGRMVYGSKWIDTDNVEIKSWIGLHLRAGLNKDSFRPTDELFSTKLGPPIYAATMSRSRFRYIKEVLRFDNIDTRDERKTPENQGK